MRIYFAGNFPQVISGNEPEVYKLVLSLSDHYCRLISFHFIDSFMPVLELKKNEDILSKRFSN